MRRSAFILSLVAALAGAGSAAASELPYGPSLSFSAWRNGERIGSHTLRFERDGGRLTVSTTIDLAVKFMGFTAYRYQHRAREVWNGDVLVMLASDTNDNGRNHAVKAGREGSALVVTGDAGAARPLPSQILPSSHWNIRQVGQSLLLNTQTGREARVSVTRLGREPVKTASGSIDATRYRYTGDVAMDQWFDDRGRWVKAAFTASDGSTVEYVLQE
ncbi:MAG: DUF6134 family protein [Reyranellaceae bacterium]